MQPTPQGKSRAVLAHITTIGWIIALIMNSKEKDEFASFYIRQVLGIVILAIVASAVALTIPVLGLLLPLFTVGLLVYSLVGAFQGKRLLVPFVGDKFQEWFKMI